MIIKTKKESKVEILEVDIDFNKHGIINILGPNGCGKSTIAKYIMDNDSNCCIVGDYVEIPDELKVSDIIDITNNYASELTSRIKNNASKKIKNLSTGEKRLLEIYYVLSQNPKIIILDEITNGLDVNIKDTIMDIIDEIKNNILVINITHSPKEVLTLTGANLVYDHGNFVEIKIANEEQLKEVMYEQL